MPKKPARNAYYYFMLHFRDEQKKKGITYANLGEVQRAADPVWRNASSAERTRFESIAKKEKEKYGGSDKKYTTSGITVSEVERQERVKQESEQLEIKQIKNFVVLNSFNNAIVDEEMFVMDVNSYCRANNHYIVAEFTIVRFSLRLGAFDYYHDDLYEGKIPVGYAADFKLSCIELGLKMPDETKSVDYLCLLSKIIDYLRKSNPNSNLLPPLYTMPGKVAEIKDFIYQCCCRAGEDESLFRVYKLDTLFYFLMNSLKNSNEEGLPKNSLALAQLAKDPFMYTAGLGCEFHEKTPKLIECTLSRTLRWAYTILDSCCPIVGIETVPGKHIPYGVDVDTILSFKEMKRDEASPYIRLLGEHLLRTPSSSSVVNDEACSSSVVMDVPKKEKRVHKPLRMPKTNVAENYSIPEITTSDFPPLRVGHGRGRLANSFDKLKL